MTIQVCRLRLAGTIDPVLPDVRTPNRSAPKNEGVCKNPTENRFMEPRFIAGF